jgi:hypothetical protein
MTPAERDLETLADRELRRLPLPRAPQTLLPRVIGAVQHWTERPWYTRAWFAWPAAWRVSSLAPVVLLAYLVWRLPPAPSEMAAATSAARVLWDLMIAPLVPYLLAVVVLMGLTCVAFGLALNYVLLEKVEQR